MRAWYQADPRSRVLYMLLSPAFRLVPLAAAICLFGMGATGATGAAAGPPAPAPPPNGYYIHWPEAKAAPPEPCGQKQGEFKCSIERSGRSDAARFSRSPTAVYRLEMIAALAIRESRDGRGHGWRTALGSREPDAARSYAGLGVLRYYLNLTQK